ncbi:MAG: 4-diphosphocytidyl-2C-methyl-D-erythritol kinase [Agarilytica sp.]
MEFLEASNSEWCDMWEALGEHGLNKGDPICLFMGACWEYMGSTEDHHIFRHLKHPATGAQEFAYIERTKMHLSWADQVSGGMCA